MTPQNDYEKNKRENSFKKNLETKSVCDAILEHLIASRFDKEVEKLVYPFEHLYTDSNSIISHHDNGIIM